MNYVNLHPVRKKRMIIYNKERRILERTLRYILYDAGFPLQMRFAYLDVCRYIFQTKNEQWLS